MHSFSTGFIHVDDLDPNVFIDIWIRSWIWLILVVNLVMLVSVSNLAEAFAAVVLAFEGLFRDVSSHVIVQLVKIVENYLTFLELAVVEPIVLSAGTNSALFKLVNPKFLIRRNETLETSDVGIEITAVDNVNLHLISYSVSIFEGKEQFF